ncbi:hypothetical protein PNQ92_09430 [Halobacterium salinarum]|nr:hypothetical protein [Halobacterium salinarum]
MTDLTISNKTTRARTVTVQATRLSDSERLLDDTFVLDAQASTEYEEVSSGSSVKVHASVEDGPEATHEWSDGESDATGLLVSIMTDSVEFAEAVR